ncbi:MAG: hypothetical protein CM1200mP10_09860 [Candidatus Neomarinimicrobiota bacterium]|nr:MAG: hypothetical protein CM1200mP10_09860 [Candidatus Neomarinimicrobiota bacterium]
MVLLWKPLEEGQRLATLLQQIGNNFNVATDIVFSSMDQPLGRYAGLWCEVKEAINCLQSDGPEDTMAVTFELGSRLLIQAKTVSEKGAAMIMQRELIETGLAMEKFMEMVSAHGGNQHGYSVLSDIAFASGRNCIFCSTVRYDFYHEYKIDRVGKLRTGVWTKEIS